MKKQLFLSLALAAMSLFGAQEAQSATATNCQPNPFSGFGGGIFVGASKVETDVQNDALSPFAKSLGAKGLIGNTNQAIKKTSPMLGMFFEYLHGLNNNVNIGVHVSISANTGKGKKETKLDYVGTDAKKPVVAIGKFDNWTERAGNFVYFGADIPGDIIGSQPFSPSEQEPIIVYGLGNQGSGEYVVETKNIPGYEVASKVAGFIPADLPARITFNATPYDPKLASNKGFSGNMNVSTEISKKYGMKALMVFGVNNNNFGISFGVGPEIASFDAKIKATSNGLESSYVFTPNENVPEEILGYIKELQFVQPQVNDRRYLFVSDLNGYLYQEAEQNVANINKDNFDGSTIAFANSLIRDFYQIKTTDLPVQNLTVNKKVTLVGLCFMTKGSYKIGNSPFSVEASVGCTLFKGKKVNVTPDSKASETTKKAIEGTNVTIKPRVWEASVGIKYTMPK